MTKTTKTSQVTQSETLEQSAEPQAAAGEQVTPLIASEPSQLIAPQEQPPIEPSQPEQVNSEKSEPQLKQPE